MDTAVLSTHTHTHTHTLRSPEVHTHTHTHTHPEKPRGSRSRSQPQGKVGSRMGSPRPPTLLSSHDGGHLRLGPSAQSMCFQPQLSSTAPGAPKPITPALASQERNPQTSKHCFLGHLSSPLSRPRAQAQWGRLWAPQAHGGRVKERFPLQAWRSLRH